MKRVTVATDPARSSMPLFCEIQKPKQEREGARDFAQIRGGHFSKRTDELLLVGARITFTQTLCQRADSFDPLREAGSFLLSDHPHMGIKQEREQLLMNSIYTRCRRHLERIVGAGRSAPLAKDSAKNGRA
jgi:hypothetical protein